MKRKSFVIKGAAARKFMAASMVAEHGSEALDHVTGPMKEAVQEELNRAKAKATGNGGAL